MKPFSKVLMVTVFTMVCNFMYEGEVKAKTVFDSCECKGSIDARHDKQAFYCVAYGKYRSSSDEKLLQGSSPIGYYTSAVDDPSLISEAEKREVCEICERGLAKFDSETCPNKVFRFIQ